MRNRMTRRHVGVCLGLGRLDLLGRHGMRQQPHQRVEQLRLVQRLGQVGAEQPLGVARLAPAEGAEQHQRQARPAGMDALRELQAVHLGHVHVQDRDVELFSFLDPAQRLRRRLGGAGHHAPLAHLQVEHAAFPAPVACRGSRAGSAAAARPAARES
jgi:hypothetical protein